MLVPTTRLLDQRLTLAGSRGGPYHARYELIELESYPPRLEGLDRPAPPPVYALEYELDAEHIDSLLPPAWLNWRDHLEQMNRAAGALLDPVADVVRSVMERAVPAASLQYARSPATVSRFTFRLESPHLWVAPWEDLWWQPPFPHPDVSLREQFLVLRRNGGSAGQRSRTPTLPLRVAIRIADYLPAWDWERALFDRFAHAAQEVGSITWSRPEDDRSSADVEHIVFDDYQEMVGPRLVRERLAERPEQPRLLVLHGIWPVSAPLLMGDLGRQALEQGVDAVLIAGARPGDFFPEFYRKLLHNRPLDECVLAASRYSLHGGCLLAAREGGEYGLLLTRAVQEATAPLRALRRRVRSASPPPSAGAESAGADDGGSPQVSFGGADHFVDAEGLESFTPEERGRDIGLREQRLAAALGAAARQALGEWAGEIEARHRERLNETQIHEELGDLAGLARHHAELRDEVAGVTGADQAIVDLVADVSQLPARSTHVWLAEAGPAARVLPGWERPVAGRSYTLNVQIGRVSLPGLSVAFPEELLKPVFERMERAVLDVVLFTDDPAVFPGERAGRIVLPRVGDSSAWSTELRVEKSGALRVRVCLYYQRVLLQSLVLEAEVQSAGVNLADGGPGLQVLLDYSASTDFSLLDELPSPVLTLFTNDAPDGSLWIGAFGNSAAAGFPLRSGDMITASPATLATLADQVRSRLFTIEGEGNYNFVPPSLELTPEQLDRCELALAKLARTGYLCFDEIFLSSDMDAVELQRSLGGSSLVSVARCREDGASLPWAALYTFPIDQEPTVELRLCSLFREQLRANRWSNDGSELQRTVDLLDDPQGCRSQPGCPLATKAANRTVCPFGFWGFLHQIEQPLQQVAPAPPEKLSGVLHDRRLNQTSLIQYDPANGPRIAMAAFPGFPDAKEHGEELLVAHFPEEYSDERAEALASINEGGRQIYYFYCHGEIRNNTFRLLLGPVRAPAGISAADLVNGVVHWSDPLFPLVVLNGCKTVALTPERVGSFLKKLRNLGASGVVGTEIPVWTQLARPFGRMLLEQLSVGRSTGEAFLEIRRFMLRQGNPMGLAYTLYAPATLHLHPGPTCQWCRDHRPVEPGGPR